ncbi:hypothetical protein RI129_008700 [Pyrocoelia pectoralis]|uniref:Transmembrane protein 177 n=1 Tax=Pyrocoelia pectoralis TaxID=417401 RepID=A0AAN7ZKD1_9COLE
MNFQRLSAWFLKDSGKKFVFGCAVATSVGIGCVQIFPNTFLLDKYKEIIHLYKNGFTVPVSRSLLERFNKALELLEIDEIHHKQFNPFMTCGFDILSAGTYYSHFGVIIGLPINYTYIDVEHIEKSKIKILDQGVAWETDEGDRLLKSLAVSENAQIYAIAHEIQMRQTPKYFSDLFSSMGLFIGAYSVGNHMNKKYNLYGRSFGLRLCLYGLIGSFALVNYLFIKDATQVYYEKKTDEFLKSKSPVFQEGGKEFYESILNRNKALRSIMGKVGEYHYTLMGNENYGFRQKHLPLVQRRAFFEESHLPLQSV